MCPRSSIASRVFVAVVVVAVVLGGGTAGLAAATPPTADGSTAEETESTSLAGVTTETIAVVGVTVNETTDTLENTTNETTETIDETVDETTDALDDGTESTTDAIDGTVSETDAVTGAEVSTTVDGRSLFEWLVTLEPRLEAAVDLETGLEVSVGGETDDDGSDNETATDAEADESENEAGTDEEPATGTSPAADAVLVGALGAIAASGAAAAGGGAGGSGAAGLAANSLSQSGVGRLRHAAARLPWKLLPILKYSRYDDSDPLENDRRRAVYETIADEPGRYLSEISDRSGVALSTVRHHVRVLEDEGLVRTAKVNGKRRYYLAAAAADGTDGEIVENVELHAALAEPAKRDVLEALAALGSVANGRLADELNRDPSTVSHHLSTLEDDGLVVREKEGRSVVNELAPDVKAALRDADGVLEDEPAEASAPADD